MDMFCDVESGKVCVSEREGVKGERVPNRKKKNRNTFNLGLVVQHLECCKLNAIL